MSVNLQLAQSRLLEPGELSMTDLELALGKLAGGSVDYADLYFQHKVTERWVLENRLIKNADYSIDAGVGVRAVSGEKTGFAFSDLINKSALLQSAETARRISTAGQSGQQPVLHTAQPQQHYTHEVPNDVSAEEKMAYLRRIDEHLRSKDSRVQQVIASLTVEHDTIMVTATDGTLAADVRPLCSIVIQVVVHDRGKTEISYLAFGGREPLSAFLNSAKGLESADKALRQALIALEAKPAPAGDMPVVIGNGWAGVLLHEAVGHGLEGDFNRKEQSTYSGRIGEKVASEHCTIVDDGTLTNLRGSLNIDDEGVSTKHNVLVEKGILKGYMQDKLNARLMGVEATGNGRRESYAYVPMPRMTNTFMLPGSYELDEIISTIDHGIYAADFGGGQVDITSGQFTFSVKEAYMIEKGKITYPLRGVELIGDGPTAMQRVSMVGKDLAHDPGMGSCGKNGQMVPVGIGQPSMKIDLMTVGGTEA